MKPIDCKYMRNFSVSQIFDKIFLKNAIVGRFDVAIFAQHNWQQIKCAIQSNLNTLLSFNIKKLAMSIFSPFVFAFIPFVLLSFNKILRILNLHPNENVRFL
jgi:hypothetical protein